MFSKIYRILVSLFGESRQGYYDPDTTQYQFNSPWAAEDNDGVWDNKYNLEVSFLKFKYHDWAYDYGGDLLKLIKEWGTPDLVREFRDCVEECKTSGFISGELDSINSIRSHDPVKLPNTFKKVDLSKCQNRKVLEYLEKRKITQDLIDFYNIGYTEWKNEVPKYRNRIIIPSYDAFGELNYWAGRDYTGKAFAKYWNSDKDSNAPEKTEIVFNEYRVQFDSDIYLVEGIFDSIYLPNAIPLMGKVLKSEFKLYKTLQEKANANVVICLDSDTELSETLDIYRSLDIGRLRGHIRYIRLTDHKDFGEIYEAEGKSGIIKMLGEENTFPNYVLEKFNFKFNRNDKENNRLFRYSHSQSEWDW